MSSILCLECKNDCKVQSVRKYWSCFLPQEQWFSIHQSPHSQPLLNITTTSHENRLQDKLRLEWLSTLPTVLPAKNYSSQDLKPGSALALTCRGGMCMTIIFKQRYKSTAKKRTKLSLLFSHFCIERTRGHLCPESQREFKLILPSLSLIPLLPSESSQPGLPVAHNSAQVATWFPELRSVDSKVPRWPQS